MLEHYVLTVWLNNNRVSKWQAQNCKIANQLALSCQGYRLQYIYIYLFIYYYYYLFLFCDEFMQLNNDVVVINAIVGSLW